MSKRIPLHHVLIPVASTIAVVGILWLVVLENPRRLSDRSLRGEELLAQVVSLVEERYIRELDDMEVTYDAIRGVVEGLDPYSQFYDPREKVDFQEETEGKFGGIGVSVRIDLESGRLVVVYPILDSPSDLAGIEPCDTFFAIDGEFVPPIRTLDGREAVVSRLKGEPGTKVRVVLDTASGERREVELERAEIPTRSVVGIERIDPDAGIGYLAIQGFQETTLEEFDAAIEELRQEPPIRSLVIDLRFNPGGILDGAIELADRFLSSGTIVSTRGRTERSNRDYSATLEGTLPDDLALAVLINGDAASASEVFAGAIQDHRRGILVGEPTYGKGVVQNVLYLNRDAVVLKVTSAAYFTPSGSCIEKHVDVPGVGRNDGGVQPDLYVRDLPRDPRELQIHLARARPGEDYAAHYEPCVVNEADAGRAERDADTFEDPQLAAALSALRGETVSQRLVGELGGAVDESGDTADGESSDEAGDGR